MLSILRHYKYQYALKCAPLALTHGAILAAEAKIAITRFQNFSELPNKVPILKALDEALLDLSHSWKIAGDARCNLQKIVNGQETSTPTPPGAFGQEIG
ncbi:hypothetical protein B7494_g2838 [Chlorociboria aeruginascens]|nr:hypothetical protein B7494_g2838 [Chlorociboria aeruginascens]